MLCLHRWALIRDEKVAKRAYEYVQKSVMGASRDTQLRMLGIVKAMMANLYSTATTTSSFSATT